MLRGGWCEPLHRIDFGSRPGLRDSGWCITRDDLEAHYRKAREFCGIPGHPGPPPVGPGQRSARRAAHSHRHRAVIPAGRSSFAFATPAPCEDALTLRSITDGSVDVIVTDPPWGEYDQLKMPLSDFCAALAASFDRVLNPVTGRFVILVARRRRAGYHCSAFPVKVVATDLQCGREC